MHAFFLKNEDFHGFSPSDIPHLEEDDGLYEGIEIAIDEFVQMAIQTDDNEQYEDRIDGDETETPPLPCVSCREAFSMCDGLTRFFAVSLFSIIRRSAYSLGQVAASYPERTAGKTQADEACMKFQSSVSTCANI
ncbi:hypothetical protein ACJMK2_035218 [Sinanodonta woodiana]|uniref:Uncharacterized protein n=1 Tax=Sinanodonta woodiana TaxID=1069815 RepID=A0ABD3WU67_SINWO